MPNITKHFHIDITPEQFLNACSKEEILELDLLIEKYLKIYKLLDNEAVTESPVPPELRNTAPVCTTCNYIWDGTVGFVSNNLCYNCWEGNTE